MTIQFDQFIRDLKKNFQSNAENGLVGKRFMGIVEAIEIHADKDLVIFDVRNGGQCVSCAIPTQSDVGRDDIPMAGDSVQGILNQAAAAVNVGHRTVLAVLDFENISAGERRKARDFFNRPKP